MPVHLKDSKGMILFPFIWTTLSLCVQGSECCKAEERLVCRGSTDNKGTEIICWQKRGDEWGLHYLGLCWIWMWLLDSSFLSAQGLEIITEWQIFFLFFWGGGWNSMHYMPLAYQIALTRNIKTCSSRARTQEVDTLGSTKWLPYSSICNSEIHIHGGVRLMSPPHGTFNTRGWIMDDDCQCNDIMWCRDAVVKYTLHSVNT